MKPLTKRQAIASARARLAANPKDAAAQRFLERHYLKG